MRLDLRAMAVRNVERNLVQCMYIGLLLLLIYLSPYFCQALCASMHTDATNEKIWPKMAACATAFSRFAPSATVATTEIYASFIERSRRSRWTRRVLQ